MAMGKSDMGLNLFWRVYVITSCVHVRNLHLGANVRLGANLLHRICTTYKGGANSHRDANLHTGAFS